MKRRLILLFVVALILLSAMPKPIPAPGTIDLALLYNYANQAIPAYIAHDNTPANNVISDGGATLGRVLFYDKNLSVDGTVSCASCHVQEFAFGDTALVSQGVSGVTARHTMRLVNARFNQDPKFFWDERAASLEDQTMQPIQDHTEMGFSGTAGDPDIDSLVVRLNSIDYYDPLFEYVFGDTLADTTRMKLALAQFIRSIQSFDTKYDSGRVQVNNDLVPNPSLSAFEDMGRNLFITLPSYDVDRNRFGNGMGCGGCHNGPEFDVTPNSGNNAVVDEIDGSQHFGITHAPSLRNLFNVNGVLNGPLMHNGAFPTFESAFLHYDSVPGTTGTDFRLFLNGIPSKLHSTQAERDAVEAFLRTLTGTEVFTDPRWSDPFDPNGELVVIPAINPGYQEFSKSDALRLYPNPSSSSIRIEGGTNAIASIRVTDMNGKVVLEKELANWESLDIRELKVGLYILRHASEGQVRYSEFMKMD